MAANLSSVTIRATNPFGGDASSVIADIAFSAAYTAGGDIYTPAMFNMFQVDFMAQMDVAVVTATTAYVLQFDLTNKKIMLMTSNGAAPGALLEVGNGNYSTVTARIWVIGNFDFIFP